MTMLRLSRYGGWLTAVFLAAAALAGELPDPQPVCPLMDSLFDDLNGNGVRDPNEPGWPDVTVHLCNAGGVVARTSTGADGRFLFSGQWPGEYYLKCVTPSGSSPTLPNQGSPEFDSDAQANGQTR